MTVLYALNDQLGMNHKMHDTRDTFASLCQLYNIDIYIRKKVLGHKLNDITFDIYTNASKNKLWTEINKIKFQRSMSVPKAFQKSANQSAT